MCEVWVAVDRVILVLRVVLGVIREGRTAEHNRAGTGKEEPDTSGSAGAIRGPGRVITGAWWTPFHPRTDVGSGTTQRRRRMDVWKALLP
jgi:hypothetical protein